MATGYVLYFPKEGYLRTKSRLVLLEGRDESPRAVSISLMPDANDDVPGPVSPELLGSLLDERAAALELYARQMCDCAEDVVQEAFIELAKQRQAPRDVVAWLYRVVHNRALLAARSARRRRLHEAEASTGAAHWFIDTADEAVDARTAAEALQGLRVEERQMIVAHLWGGLTFLQIGELLGVSDSTAHRRYTAALATLRGKLGIPCTNLPRNMNR